MPIRVEHGPNLAPVGQLAYQTGQLEYRNKRRTELERLAMQQAEMRQRAQQQQNQIAATLQGQKMSYMGAMQRLQLGQQFGQINAEQANQWKVQADVKAQENRMIWGKQLGQNQLDLANMNAGIADQRAIKNIQNAHRQEQAFQNLNPAGEGEWLNIGKQIVAAGTNPKIPPQELEGHIAQLRARQDALVDQDEMTYGKKNKVGYEAPDMWDEDGQVTRIRFVPGVDSTGTPIVKYKQPTSRFTTDPDGNQLEIPLTTQEYAEQGNDSVTINGYVYPTEWDEDLGRMKQVQGVKGEMTDERRAQEEEKERAEAERERHDKWYIDREHDRQELKAKLEAEAAATITPLTPEQVDMLEPAAYHAARPVPIVPVGEVDARHELEFPALMDQEVAPVAPVAPPADAGGINIGPPGGLHGLGGPNIGPPAGIDMDAAPVDQAAQEQQLQQLQQQQQRDPTQAIGSQGNPWPTEQMANAPSGAWVIPGPGIPAMIKE